MAKTMNLTVKLQLTPAALQNAIEKGWVQMKQFRLDESERLGVCPGTICRYLAKGRYKQLKIKRFNSRVVFVQNL